MAAAVSVRSTADSESSHPASSPGLELPRRVDDWGFSEYGETGVDEENQRRTEEELLTLTAEEIESRLERTRREFHNRRKIIIKNLPADISNQEVHDLLSNYDLKYCFVDKYKGTAFVTLLNGEQAKSAIKEFHQYVLRDKEISVQLQPTDALLCIANLPLSYTQQQFDELVRPFGNIERCFLVYSENTGHSKGYGFVEYMKKDSAARAKSELLGKQLGTRMLYVHWTEVNSLTYPLLHSRCLCVDRLPRGLKNADDLRELFASFHQPVFCQLAQGQDGHFKRFAVLEFETSEIAESVQRHCDGLAFGTGYLRVSFCAPGPPGRSMLAALIAAQAMALNRGKGLLPEPNALQILTSLNNPATLKLLLNPLLQGPQAPSGRKHGILGTPPSLPFLGNPAISTALLQMLLQNQTPPQQTGILGESPLAALPPMNTVQGGGIMNDLIAGGVLPGVGLHSDVPSASVKPSHLPGGNVPLPHLLGGVSAERESPTPIGLHLPPQSSSTLPGIANPVINTVLASLQQNQGMTGENGPSLPGVSILGEPPKDLKMQQNPFLNIQSIFPGAGMSGTPTKLHSSRKKPTVLGNMSNPRLSSVSQMDFSIPPTGRYQDNYGFRDHRQDNAYQLQESPESVVRGLPPHRSKGPYPASYSEWSNFGPSSSVAPFNAGSPSSYFQSGIHAGLKQSHLNKAVGMPSVNHGGGMYGYGLSSSPTGSLHKTPGGGQKRVFSHLIPSPEPSPEGGYIGQHSQGLGGHYADSYLKRKRIF
uniref:Ribonucleoprotein PTB-binding 1 n=1 Tax=Erpetoichthys calabaricus TaxID=27687 RepID=A0A8C4XFC2_ERPCA